MPSDAFRLWTAGVNDWWPMATHSVSGDADAKLLIEPFAGGRILERTPDGKAILWGSVRLFEPPNRLVFEWLIADLATELEVTFEADGDQATIVRVEHRGWDRFGVDGDQRRQSNNLGWEAVIPAYRTACSRSRRHADP